MRKMMTEKELLLYFKLSEGKIKRKRLHSSPCCGIFVLLCPRAVVGRGNLKLDKEESNDNST